MGAPAAAPARTPDGCRPRLGGCRIEVTVKPSHQRFRILFNASWIALAITGLGILGFGLVVTAVPTSGDPRLIQAIGVASIGMGLFGLVITLFAYRRRERWAWVSLWYYPAFWAAHVAWSLPPGKEHVHQIVFIVLSGAGLLLPARAFFPASRART
jgi:hypothetical protein